MGNESNKMARELARQTNASPIGQESFCGVPKGSVKEL